MDYSTRYKALSKGVKELRRELQELRQSLLSEEEKQVLAKEAVEGCEASPEVDETNAGEDFFAHLTKDDQHHETDDLFRAAIQVTTELGYASTLVLQQRLGITYRRAMNLIDQLEQEGLIGPAHGFRPHKALSAAYTFNERAN